MTSETQSFKTVPFDGTINVIPDLSTRLWEVRVLGVMEGKDPFVFKEMEGLSHDDVYEQFKISVPDLNEKSLSISEAVDIIKETLGAAITGLGDPNTVVVREAQDTLLEAYKIIGKVEHFIDTEEDEEETEDEDVDQEA